MNIFTRKLKENGECAVSEWEKKRKRKCFSQVCWRKVSVCWKWSIKPTNKSNFSKKLVWVSLLLQVRLMQWELEPLASKTLRWAQPGALPCTQGAETLPPRHRSVLLPAEVKALGRPCSSLLGPNRPTGQLERDSLSGYSDRTRGGWL